MHGTFPGCPRRAPPCGRVPSGSSSGHAQACAPLVCRCLRDVAARLGRAGTDVQVLKRLGAEQLLRAYEPCGATNITERFGLEGRELHDVVRHRDAAATEPLVSNQNSRRRLRCPPPTQISCSCFAPGAGRQTALGRPVPSRLSGLGAARAEVRALYEGPAEDVPWFVTVDGVEVRAITRHASNNRVNGVARERYAGIVAKQGLLAEMRVPQPAPPSMAGRGKLRGGECCARPAAEGGARRMRRCPVMRRKSFGMLVVGPCPRVSSAGLLGSLLPGPSTAGSTHGSRVRAGSGLSSPEG